MKICEAHRIQDAIDTTASQIVWQYVTGGRAVHAFLPGHTLPICGEAALRGPDHDRRPPRWHHWSRGISPHHRTIGWDRRRHQHKQCRTLVNKHLNTLRDQLHHQSRAAQQTAEIP